MLNLDTVKENDLVVLKDGNIVEIIGKRCELIYRFQKEEPVYIFEVNSGFGKEEISEEMIAEFC